MADTIRNEAALQALLADNASGDISAQDIRDFLVSVPTLTTTGAPNLGALQGLTLIADRLPYANGSGTLALTTFTAAGRALLDDADASAQRTTLGLGTMATAAAADYLALAGGTMTGALAIGNGTLTGSSAPVLNLTQTWNNAATTFEAFTLTATATAASGTSLLMKLSENASTRFSVDRYGTATADAIYCGFGTVFATGTANGFSVRATSFFRFSSTGSATGSIDTALYRNAAGVVEINNGTAGTYRDLRLRNVRTEATTVAGLVAAATAGAGARGFVTDATATTYLSTVSGGGANAVPVVSNGTNWLIG